MLSEQERKRDEQSPSREMETKRWNEQYDSHTDYRGEIIEGLLKIKIKGKREIEQGRLRNEKYA